MQPIKTIHFYFLVIFILVSTLFLVDMISRKNNDNSPYAKVIIE